MVENVDERHLATASWLFPLYLFGMCLFVVPIAVAGMKVLPEGANPELYVLTLPLSLGRQDLALLAFLGGFSSATSMVIVAAIAVSTMVSNHIVMPIALPFQVRRSLVWFASSVFCVSNNCSNSTVNSLFGLSFDTVDTFDKSCNSISDDKSSPFANKSSRIERLFLIAN